MENYTETVGTSYMTKAIHGSISPEERTLLIGVENFTIGNYDSAQTLYRSTFNPIEVEGHAYSSGEKFTGIEAKLDGVKTSISNGINTGIISSDPEDWADDPNKAYSKDMKTKISTETI